jgi:hypothetical protein
LSQLHRWEESHDSAPYNKTVQTCGSVTPRLPLFVPPCLSLRCTPLVHPASDSMSLAFTFFVVPLVVHPCALIWTPRVTCVKHHVFLGVSHPFTNHHTQPTVTPSWTQCTQTSPFTHQPSHLLDRHTPSLGTHPLPCALPCVDHHDSLVGVSMGSSNLSNAPMLPREDGSTPWACSQVAPSFPKCNPSLHHPSQGKKGVCPLGLTHHHRAPRCSFPHP